MAKMMTKTDELRQRIIDLEVATRKQHERYEKAEAALSTAHEEGSNADRIATLEKELSEAAASIRASVAALKRLDERLVAVSQIEAAEVRTMMIREVHDNYVKLCGQARGQIKALTKELAKSVDKPHVAEIESELDAALKKGIWRAVNRKFSREYLEKIPKCVYGAPLRNARGEIVPNQGRPVPDRIRAEVAEAVDGVREWTDDAGVTHRRGEAVAVQ